MRLSPLFLFSVVFLFSCYDRNTNDPKLVREEMRQREIVHATPAQISERAFALGDTLCSAAEKQLAIKINQSKDTSCVKAFDDIRKEFEKEYEAEISRLSFDPSGLQKLSGKKEKEVFDAILYNKENRLAIQPNFQKEGDKEFIFTKALVLHNKSCGNCHQKLSDPFLKGKTGDTIGIWKARYSKRKVILSFVD